MKVIDDHDAAEVMRLGKPPPRNLPRGRVSDPRGEEKGDRYD